MVKKIKQKIKKIKIVNKIINENRMLILKAASRLKLGHLVAFPTETVYGLGADASNPEAIAAIFTAKGRPSNHPIIVHVAHNADLTRWASAIPAEADVLINAFWPGPLTLILPRADSVRPSIYSPFWQTNKPIAWLPDILKAMHNIIFQ